MTTPTLYTILTRAEGSPWTENDIAKLAKHLERVRIQQSHEHPNVLIFRGKESLKRLAPILGRQDFKVEVRNIKSELELPFRVQEQEVA